MTVKLLTEHHLELLSLKEGYTGLSESTLVKMPHCWKSHVTAHILPVRIPSVPCYISVSDLAPHSVKFPYQPSAALQLCGTVFLPPGCLI